MSRFIAQFVVAGLTVFARAATQAYMQALVNAQKTGVAGEAAQQATSAARKVIGSITVEESRQILQVNADAAWQEVMKRYRHLYNANEKHGSFYLLSKVYRAKERLEQEYEAEGRKTPDAEDDPANSGTQQRIDKQ